MIKNPIRASAALICLLVGLAGCGTEPGQNDIAAQYIAKAQEFVDAGDYETAFAVLDEGIAVTQNASLSQYRAELEAQQTEKEPSAEEEQPEETAEAATEIVAEPASEAAAFDISAYYGGWYENGSDNESGGFYMDISEAEDGSVHIAAACIQAAPASRIGTIDLSVPKSSIVESVFTSEYMDSWGNAGAVTFTFANDMIICQNEIEKYEETAMWGFYATSPRLLIRSEDGMPSLY